MRNSLPNYTITGEIHDGIDTSVCRGYRNLDEAPVAIKLLKSEYPSARQLGRLRHEYLVLKELDHPRIVRAHELVSSGSTLALVTEHLDGAPLSDVLRREALDLEALLCLALSITEAVAAIHARQIIHKDVKPQNIMVEPAARQIKLIDFSVATSLAQETPGAKSPDLLEGTLAYISPEQTGRMNRVIDHRTDLYSLGITLYEMLSGALPFHATDPLELVHCHIAKSPQPLHEAAPRVPLVVSDIVMKLLSKGAEDRYQSARGLKLDLEECLSRLRSTGRVEPFSLGRRDQGHGLLIPQRLYGREIEAATLLAAWDRVSLGAAELVLVSGHGGVGKSALVHELYKAMAGRRASLITGKFDQLNRSVPYASLAEAFRDLARQLCAERDEVLAAWRKKLLSALGQNGQILIDLIPEMEIILGPQPRVPELGPTEAQNRFNLVFQSFLRVFSAAKHPIVLFLDDLQWADAASLKLLVAIMSDPSAAHLLVIGAYRHDEVSAGHPFSAARDEIKRARAKVVEINVEPLGIADVSDLVADTLAKSRASSGLLAALIFDKTQGNPFFINQFLAMLHKEGMITFDEERGTWRADEGRIRGAMITDNVVDLLAKKLLQLGPSTQEVVKLAACIGHRFDLRTLSTIYERGAGETAAALWDALRESVVVPLDADYRLVHSSEEGQGDGAPRAEINVAYKFSHDRVQQVAYSLIKEGEREALHLKIGRLLLAKSERGPGGEELFEVVNHLNLGASEVTLPEERLRLARMNLEAGKRAKASAAFDSAANYFTAGLRLLGEEHWEEEYELSFALHAEGAECQYLTGRFDEAEALFSVALERSRTALDRARIGMLRINLYTAVSKLPESLALSGEILSLLGHGLPSPDEDPMAAVMKELGQVAANLGERRLDDLVGHKELDDPAQRVAQKLMMTIGPVILGFAPMLYPFIAARQVNISLMYGHSDVSAFGYVAYGFSLIVMGRYEEGYSYGKLAVKLAEKWKNVEVACGVTLMFSGFMSFYKEGLHLSIPALTRVIPDALEVGNFQYALYCSTLSVHQRMSQGSELYVIAEEVKKYRALAERLKDSATIVGLTIAEQRIACLEGRTESPRSLSDASFSEPAFAEKISDGNYEFQLCFYFAVKTELAVLFEDYEGALAMRARAEKTRMSAGPAVFTTDIGFYGALALLALSKDAAPEERESHAAILRAHEAELSILSGSCPENFRHKALLVAAERARVEGDGAAAMDLYDEAIRLARENEFLHHEALANELCAKFYGKKGKFKIAKLYMADAIAGYTRFGAHAKVKDLRERYPELSPPRAQAPERTAGLLDTSTITEAGEVLDMASVIKASQAVSGEIELGKLLLRLVRIALENAGANKGYLLLENNGSLCVEAAARAEAGEGSVLMSIPLEQVEDIAHAVVRYVHKTKERVVLANAAKESMFGFDAYVAKNKPRSLLSTPIVHQGKLVGVLYLENTLTEGAFTPERLLVLQILSAQAAISIENSRLYANLEEKVRERTAELRAVQAKLLRLERESTEKRMAGGFAHEIRNALAGPKLVLAKALGSSDPSSQVSLAIVAARELGDLYEALSSRLPERELDEYTERVQRIFQSQESLDAMLRLVFKATNRALTITKKIMDFSRIGEYAAASFQVDVNKVIDSVLAEAEERIEDERICLERQIEGAVVVQGDEAYYHAILQNLVNNAHDAILERGEAERGGVIAVTTRIDGTSCVLEVADDGVGICGEDLGKIFEAFYSTKPETGTGLGLSVVKRIVDVCGGSIDVHSDVGKGSKFTVTLPIDSGSAAL